MWLFFALLPGRSMVSAIEGFFNASASAEANTTSFRDLLEDHITYFLTHNTTVLRDITAHDANVYMFDWIGALNKLGVPVELHWLTIRMNGGKSFTDFKEDARTIYVPSIQEFNKLFSLNNSVRKKK